MLKLFKSFIPHTSLRLNLLVISEVVLLLLLSLVVLLYFSRQALKEEAKSNAEQTLEGTVQHIDNILTSVEQTAYNVYQDVKLHLDQPDRMFTYCREVVECNPYVGGCAIAMKPGYYPNRKQFMAYVHKNKSGSMVTSQSFGTQPYTEHVWYTAPMKSGRALWTDPLKEEEDEGVTLSFCLPIFDKNHACVGIMAIDLPTTLLSQIVLAVKPFPNSYSVLLSRGGLYIVHPDKEKLLKHMTVFNRQDKEADPQIIETAGMMTAGETGYHTFHMNGEDYYIFYKPFQRSNEYGIPMEALGWSAGLVCLEEDILGDFNNLTYLVIVIAIVGLVLFFGLCRWLVLWEMKPLRLMTESAHRIAQGHLDEPVPNTQREDEIGQLQDHFQQMQLSLAAKASEQERLTATLQKRSKELGKAYGQVQGSDRMKTSFLHYMITQMTVPSDLIERSVTKLSNNYHDIPVQEANYEVGVIKTQSETVLDLLDHMVEALALEAEDAKKLEEKQRKGGEL